MVDPSQTWVLYATERKEIAVFEELQSSGFNVWIALEGKYIRSGKKRRAEFVEVPVLPNYIFARLTPDEYQALTQSRVKGLARTMLAIPEPALREVMAFRHDCDRSLEAARLRHEQNKQRGQFLTEFKTGDRLRAKLGGVGDILATFSRVVQKQGDEFPKIEAKTEIFGREVPVLLDVLDVKKVN